ncbi:targeting protein for Xklp2 homolog [Haliotis rubra]|uniref:targeting protein for Xklp2 homolog n=1 Tax=Haliotis rubra TaxID=36100 RepID=UPI001EE6020F|nr:targeting protein for Xklp2 homolog [Haliotis rubra]
MAETELGPMDVEWDYNCPQYVDFSEPLPLDDSADKWFDADHEDFEDSSIRISSEYKNEVQKPLEGNVKTPKVQTPTPQAQVAPMKSEGSAGTVTRQQAKMTPPSSNIITSLDEWRAKKPQTVTQSKAEKRANSSSGGDVSNLKSTDVSPVTSTSDSQRPALKRQRISGSNIRRSGSQSKLEGSNNYRRSGSQDKMEVSSKRSLKRSNSSASSSKPERIARPHTRGYSAGRPVPQNIEDAEAPCAKMPRMPTLPTTPTFMRRKQLAAGSPRVKTTEEQELEQIAQMRKELAKKRKMAKDSLLKSKNAPGYAPVCNSREPTIVQDFKFSTDSRLKSQHQDVQDESTVDFVRCLRSNTASSSQQGPRSLTRPQPFKLTTSHKPAPQTEKFQSMAQSVAAFHRSTPDRFRRKPRATSSDRKLLKARSPHALRLTQPETPKLETRHRYRAPTVPSQKDIEDQEYQEIMKYQFKANPVNTRIMSQATGLYKPEPKPATKPEEFNLHLDRRFQERPNKAADEDEFVFHAQPVPRKILEGTVGVKPAKEIPTTVPQSPAFALKHRVRLPVEIPQEKETEKPLPKAHAVPHPGIPFQPKLSHRTTTPEPFSFESRYPDPIAVKEAKLRQKLEEEQRAREFRANPLPRLEPVLPERHTKLCTKMEPFNLQSEIRGAKKSEEWNHKVLEEEQLKQKQAAMFKARPADVVHQEPFMPQRSSRALTDVSELTLNTERRAVDRDEYELRKKAREAQLAELNHEREAQKMEEEKAAIAKLRAEMVHKSNPIRKFKQVVVQGSEKPPTCPESPRFSDRLRGKVRV